MRHAASIGISALLIAIGILVVVSNPLNQTFILFGMVLIGAGILNILFKIHFAPEPKAVKSKILERKIRIRKRAAKKQKRR